MSRFAIMTLTDAATARVDEIMQGAAKDAKGIRVGVKNGGCAGMEYTVELIVDVDPKDDRVAAGEHIVFVAPQAVLFLLGTEMDHEVSKLRSGFVFNNPIC